MRVIAAVIDPVFSSQVPRVLISPAFVDFARGYLPGGLFMAKTLRLVSTYETKSRRSFMSSPQCHRIGDGLVKATSSLNKRNEKGRSSSVVPVRVKHTIPKLFSAFEQPRVCACFIKTQVLSVGGGHEMFSWKADTLSCAYYCTELWDRHVLEAAATATDIASQQLRDKGALVPDRRTRQT